MAHNSSKKRAKFEFTAGGVVYQRSKRGPLIGLILDPYRKWGFAKGHIEKGENPAEAAVRETREEMGIRDLKLIAPLGKTDIWFYERFREGRAVLGSRSLIHKVIHYFLMEAKRGVRGIPERGERIRAIRWVPISEASRMVSYRNIRPILERAIRFIRERESSRRHPATTRGSGSRSRRSGGERWNASRPKRLL